MFRSPSQDANECWIQMMRVLQQKLEAIEDDSVKEVTRASCHSEFILIVFLLFLVMALNKYSLIGR